jgi:hypothetical protein
LEGLPAGHHVSIFGNSADGNHVTPAELPKIETW